MALAASRYFLPCCLGISRAPWCWRARRGALPLSGSVDVQAHGSRRALDDPGRVLQVVGVKVGLLDLGDFADLLLGQRSDLVAVRVSRSLLDPRGLLEQLRRGRRLGDEAEGPVFEDGDLSGDYPGLVGGALVVRLAELHDVEAVRTQGRADGRRGRRFARLELQLDD